MPKQEPLLLCLQLLGRDPIFNVIHHPPFPLAEYQQRTTYQIPVIILEEKHPET
jgi:hypothetical protein